MNDAVLIIVVNVAFLAVTVLFSSWISKRSRGAEGWSVGGRSLPFVVVLLTQFATASGGGMLVAQVGLGYEFGWGVITYGLFTAGGYLALIFIVKWLRRHEFTSMPDIIKKLYGSKPLLMTLATLMSMILPFGVMCTQLVAFANLFHHLTGISPVILAICFGILGLLFVLPGGMVSVAWTDAVFGALMLVLALVIGGYAVHQAGGWPEVTVAATPERAGWAGFLAPGLLMIATWGFSLTPGTMTKQMVFQRIYAANSARAVILSLLGTATLLIGTKTYAAVLGMSAFAMNPGLDNPEDAAGTVLAGLPLMLAVVYSALIASALMSTVTSAVQSVAVNITHDIYKNYTSLQPGEGQIVRLSRIVSVCVLVAGVTLSLAYPVALDWIVSSYAYSAAGLFCPIFLGIALRRTRLIGPHMGIAGVVAGVATAAIAQAIGTTIPFVVFGIAGSATAMLVIGWLGRSRGSLARRNQTDAALSADEVPS